MSDDDMLWALCMDEQSIILAQLSTAWGQRPELRLGQLIVNAARIVGSDPFFMTDDEVLGALKKMVEDA